MPTATLTGAPVTVALLAVNLIMWIALEATGGSQNSENLYRFGAKYGPAIADGEWWRLFIPIFLHIGFFHLFANSLGLLIFGGMVERLFGSLTYAAIYVISGLLGNVASFWAGPNIGAGASGAVFGILGAFGVYLLLNRRVLGQMGRQSLISILFIVGINLVFGLRPGIDNFAHLGGLVAGGALAWFLSPRERYTAVGGSVYSSPFLELRTVRPSLALLVPLVSVSLGLIAGLTYLRAQDYPYRDLFKQRRALFSNIEISVPVPPVRDSLRWLS